MAGPKTSWGLILALAVLLGAGCSGVLFESKHEDGRVERLRVDGVESWSTYDDKPRNPSQDGKKLEDLSIMLKKEATF
jgi:hypothetical protein